MKLLLYFSFLRFLFLGQIPADNAFGILKYPINKQSLLFFPFDYETLLFGRSFYVCLSLLEV